MLLLRSGFVSFPVVLLSNVQPSATALSLFVLSLSLYSLFLSLSKDDPHEDLKTDTGPIEATGLWMDFFFWDVHREEQ